MKQIMIIMALLCGAMSSYAQLDSMITDYLARVPQEKIYIQTDRRLYVAGDTVWFRAHVVDAATNIPSTSPLYPANRSRFVYVELHDNKADTLIERAMIKQDTLGVFANAIALPSGLADGTYTLAAYTRYMMNFPQELFAYKEIDVVARRRPETPAVSPSSAVKDKDTVGAGDADGSKAEEVSTISVAALPEGGNLIAGHRQQLAFKAVDDMGHGVDVQVRLVRTDSEELIAEARSAHLGMGSLYFTPEAGIGYRLEAYADDGRSCHAPVPAALAKGVTMAVSQRKNHLYVTPIASGVDVTTLSLAIYGNGNLITIEPLTEKPVAVDTTEMHPGVVNIAIVGTAEKRVYAERLAFIYPKAGSQGIVVE